MIKRYLLYCGASGSYFSKLVFGIELKSPQKSSGRVGDHTETIVRKPASLPDSALNFRNAASGHNSGLPTNQNPECQTGSAQLVGRAVLAGHCSA